MASDQVARWASEHPSCPRSGKFFEVPPSYVFSRVGGIFVGAAVLLLSYNFLFPLPKTMSPEFLAEVKKIGPVAVSFFLLLWPSRLHV